MLCCRSADYRIRRGIGPLKLTNLVKSTLTNPDSIVDEINVSSILTDTKLMVRVDNNIENITVTNESNSIKKIESFRVRQEAIGKSLSGTDNNKEVENIVVLSYTIKNKHPLFDIPYRPLKRDFYIISIPDDMAPKKKEALFQQGRALGITFEPVASPTPQGKPDARRSEPNPPPEAFFQQGRALGITFEPAASPAPQEEPVAGGPPLDESGQPLLWANRKTDWNTTDQKSSPALWIRMHYGNRDVESWNPMGLTRRDLWAGDRPLYQALGAWLSRLKQKPGFSYPKGMEGFLISPTESLEAELADIKLASPQEAYKLFPDDPKRAERIRSALRRRR